MNNLKWISFGVVGSLFAVSHIGMIGYIASRKTEPQLPTINIPTTDYSTYHAEVVDGYKISYKANDPKTMYITKDIKEKAGFLGLANNTTKVVEEYVMDGQTNQGGPVSNKRSWIDQPPGLTQQQTQEITAARKSEECVKAIGGKLKELVGWSGLALVLLLLLVLPLFPLLVGLPSYWVAMFGGNQGANIGGNMAEDLNKNC